MTLLYPIFLWLLIPILILFFIQKKKNLLLSTHLIILALLLITLSRPVIKEGFKDNMIQAKDIIIALDVSYSMQATDIKPTRYDFAKNTINALLQQNAQDNIMLVAFTTNPLLLSPPTTDHALISIALESFNPKYILTKGTSLKNLFSKLSTMTNTDKNLILLTDGGEEDNVNLLAEQLKNTHLNLIVLAMGTKQGTTIMDEKGMLLKDNKNHLVVSRINPILQHLSTLTNGTYMNISSSPEATASSLHKALENTKQLNLKIKKKQYSYKELYQIPLFVSILLFIMLHTSAAKYLIIILTFFGTQVQASSLWDGYYLHQAYHMYEKENFKTAKEKLKKIEISSLQSQFALANIYYKLKNYKKSITIYKSIHSTHPQIKQKLFYNTANAYTMLQEYDKAKMYYTKALQLGEDAASLYNFKLVVLLKKSKDARLGIAHPKSQNSNAHQSKTKQKEEAKEKKNNEDQPSSGAGAGKKQEKNPTKEKKKLTITKEEKEHPLSSKVYELINKGYMRETQPW